MYTPPLNLNLLRDVLEVINKVEGPNEDWTKGWNQNQWRCETGMCAAGWANYLSGRQWVDEVGNAYDDKIVWEQGDPVERIEYLEVVDKNNDFQDVLAIEASVTGRTLLGLTQNEAEVLFAGHNNIHEMNFFIGNLLDGKNILGNEPRDA